MDTNSYLHPPFLYFPCRYEGQRDMLYNQTYNLDQVAFAAEGLKDAQETVCIPPELPKKNLGFCCYFPFQNPVGLHSCAFHWTDDCNEGCQ